MLRLGLPEIRSVLCLGAHADDIEIGCGGTILQLLAKRPSLSVCWVVLGADGPRAEEAQSSAHTFLSASLARDIVVAGFRDTCFPHQGGEIKEFIESLRSRVSPDLILTHRRDDLHQDHRVVSDLTWCAFRDHLILEYEIPKYDGDLGRPNVFVPLPEETCRQKIDEIVCRFRTQREKPWFSPDTFWALLRLRGVECHSPSKFAEAFHARKVSL